MPENRPPLRLMLPALFMLWTLSASFVARGESRYERPAEELRTSMSAGRPTSQGQVVSLFHHLDQDLAGEQDQEIAAYFRDALGMELPRGQAQERLRSLSAQNLSRLTAPRTEPSRDFAVVYEKLSPWFQHYQHNMWMMASKADQQPYWLSSRQLETLGLKPGLQIAPFNKDFLRTQNWIFFLVNGDRADEYGDNYIKLDSTYAESHGLISPYMMYDSELTAFALKVTPDLAHQMMRELEETFPRVRQGIYLDEASYFHALTKEYRKQTQRPPWEYKDYFAKFRAELRHYTFTPDDFRKLLAAKLADHFRSRRLLHPIEYMKKEINRALLTEVLSRAGLPARYELRVPVAIPNAHLTFGGTCASSL